MMAQHKQVNADHYTFQDYMSKPRWGSIWHQLDELLDASPDRVLEVGPGIGLFKNAAASYGISVETLDLDPDLKPDHLGSATSMPFQDGAFSCVCAFQMLEHLPYDDALKAFSEMARVSSGKVIISLPDARSCWRYTFHIPFLGERLLLVRQPFWRARPADFTGEHYWEVNKKGYGLDRVLSDFSKIRKLEKTYRVFDNPYHRFLIFS
jgi:SAM-dependent methyltransferase